MARIRRLSRGKKTASSKGKKSSSRIESGSGVVSGAKGFSRTRKQQERQQEEYERRVARPFPFRITQKDIAAKKNTVDLLYLDKEPFFVRLHTVPNGRGGFDDEICIADTGDVCPLCQKLGKEGSWTLVLTVLDKRPYRNREGKLIKQSKKLAYIKSRNIDKYERQYNKHKTFRGLVVTHRRHGGKEASIGEDLEFSPKLVSEAKIAKYGDLGEPADYAKAFVALSPEEMEQRYAHVGAGGSSSGGYSRGGSASDDDDVPDW